MLTAAEFARRIVSDPIRRATIELYPEHSKILDLLPFENISGNSYTRNLDDEDNPSGVDTRAINDNYVESTGLTKAVSRTLIMMGGTAKIDRYHIATQSGNEVDLMAEEIRKKVQGSARLFDKLFIKGDSGTTATEFDGLQASVTSGQTQAMGSTVGGDVLTLTALDELIDAIQGSPSVLIMNKKARRKVNNLMRAANQATEEIRDGFGRLIPYYGGIPIVALEVDHAYDEILDFNEDDFDGDAALCTSIYAAKFGPDGLYGIQSSPPIIDQQGWIGNSKQVVIDWFVNILIGNPKAVARLSAVLLE